MMPSKISEYLNKLSEYTTSGGIYAYRGQSNAAWEVESAAYRRLKKSDSNPPNKNKFISYHIKQILEPTRMNGYGINNGRKLKEKSFRLNEGNYEMDTIERMESLVKVMGGKRFSCKELTK